MSDKFMAQDPDDSGEYIYRMTITLRNGVKIRRANGRPFRIKVRGERKL